MRKHLFGQLGLLACVSACAVPADDGGTPAGLERADGKFDTSVEALITDFEFSGKLRTSRSFGSYDKKIEQQLLYTVGQLNGDNSVGRLDRVELSGVDVREEPNGDVVVSYDARMPVAWGKRDNIPQSYTFKLPYNTTSAGLDDFASKYGHDCVDWGAHDVDSGSMWYYYRPERCSIIDASDITEITASVSVSNVNTTGKYPEYHKIWEDDAFRAVVIFGKDKEGATSSSDAGIGSYNRFIRAMENDFHYPNLRTEPATYPATPGIDAPDITFFAETHDGRTIEVVVLLVDNVVASGTTFDRRYEALTPLADFIIYNGHSGLGANIRAMASKGRWQAGQYKVVFMNGCDTHAYVDSALSDAHAAINADDPNGTKYVDVVTNALPASIASERSNTMAFLQALANDEEPATFEQIMARIDPAQVVLVTGEQDNEFVPGFGDNPPPQSWQGWDERATIAQGDTLAFETPSLPAGAYGFVLDGAGDADLYVRVGLAPSFEHYDCRPYRVGSREACRIELPSPAPIHVMLHGYQSADVTLRGFAE